MSKGRNIAGIVISGGLTLLFLMSSMAKFFGAEPVMESFGLYDLLHMRLVIGTGELTSAFLYIFPLTASLGVLLLSAYMGGAIVTHMANGEPYIVQSGILILVWAGYYLRFPEMLISFTRNSAPSDAESTDKKD